jgi:hypothetical protein
VEEVTPQELARALTRLLEWAEESSERDGDEEGGLRARILDHLGAAPSELPVVSAPLKGFERANFQVAVDAYLAVGDRGAELIGLPEMHGYRSGLAELVRSGAAGWMAEEGLGGESPVEYETVTVGEREIVCVAAGLWLIDDGDTPLALLLRREDHGPAEAELGLEVMAPGRAAAEAFVAEIRALMAEHNVYRGRVLTLTGSPFGGVGVEVRRLPPVRREGIVLPPGVLERIERHTRTFSEHAEQLQAAGRHLKRGLLLHGPPGTGKTLTAMYLSAIMPERTVVLLAGESLAAINVACEMARTLTPAMVVLEDVDLVAEDRQHGRPTSVLFELLNEMDGLNEDVDVIFVLTTNRPAALEPALAARPGRIDLAVELPMPDAEGRSRLLDLYGEGLALSLSDRAGVVARIDGVSPAYIRELLRRAALLAAERGDARSVDDGVLAAALEELPAGEGLTGSLLGRADPAPP